MAVTASSEAVADLLGRAEALAEQAAVSEAIDLLSSSDVTRGAAEAEVYSVQLRHRAFESLDRALGRDSWPPRPPDPCPEVSGRPPEVDAARLDADVLGGAIAHHGCLLVRGLLRRADAQELAAGIDRAFAEREAHLEGRPVTSTSPWYHPFEPLPPAKPMPANLRSWVREGGAMWAADSPRLLAAVLRLLSQMSVVETIGQHFGERPALTVNKSTLRKVTTSATPAWHQDGAFMGQGQPLRAVNLWIALTRCGGDARVPALEMLPCRLEEILETGTEGAWVNNEVGSGVVARVAGGRPIVRPAFEPGDALLFDEHFLHRTAVDEHMDGVRHAVEWWFFAPSCFPKGYAPLVL